MIFLTHFRENTNIDRLRDLINLGIDVNQIGYMKIGKTWWQGTPLKLSLVLQKEFKSEVVDQMVVLFSQNKETQWTKVEQNGGFSAKI